MKFLMMLSLSLLGAVVLLFIQGEWKTALVVLAVDFVISWIGGYLMIQGDKNR
jgi:hypothetical protein